MDFTYHVSRCYQENSGWWWTPSGFPPAWLPSAQAFHHILMESRGEAWCSPFWFRGGEPAFVAPPPSQMHILELHFTASVSSVCGMVPSFILIVTQLFSLFICCLKWCKEDKWESFRWFECIMLVAGQHSAVAFGLARGFQCIRDKHYTWSHSEFYTPTRMATTCSFTLGILQRYIGHCCYVKNL